MQSMSPPGIPVGMHWRGIMDQSMQSGLRLVGSWPVAHSFECPLKSESVLLTGSWLANHSQECPLESWTSQGKSQKHGFSQI
eukprot:1722406-Amphidinium_carterae.4